MRTHTIQLRLLLWSWAVFVSALLLVFVFYNQKVSRQVIEDAAPITERDLDLLEWVLQDKAPYAGRAELQHELDRMSPSLGFCAAWVAEDGVAAQACPPGKEHLFAATEMHVARGSELEGLGLGVLRISDAYSPIRRDLSRQGFNLLLVFIVTVVGSALVVFWLSRTMTGSVRAFAAMASAIGEGAYDRRIRTFPVREFQPLAAAINAMAERIESNIAVITSQKQQVEAIFEGMSAGVMVLDEQGRIEAHNPALAELFPDTTAFVERTPLEATLLTDVQDAVDEMRANPDLKRLSITVDLADRRTVYVTLVSFLGRGGGRLMILAFHDVTDLKRVENVLKDFVANVSHQLRTPLTSIKGYAETLLDLPPSRKAERREVLETILRNADHMTKVIAGMFQLVKSERMGVKLEGRPVALAAILDQALMDLTHQAADKGVELVAEGLPPADLMIHGDADALLQVFDNLLDNAVKYGPEGSTVTLTCEAADMAVQVCIEDQGPGVPKEDRARIFERFYRVDKNAIDRNGSAGLGLAICRHIITSFGGSIWVEPGAEGGGAVFCVGLRRA